MIGYEKGPRGAGLLSPRRGSGDAFRWESAESIELAPPEVSSFLEELLVPVIDVVGCPSDIEARELHDRLGCEPSDHLLSVEQSIHRCIELAPTCELLLGSFLTLLCHDLPLLWAYVISLRYRPPVR